MGWILLTIGILLIPVVFGLLMELGGEFEWSALIGLSLGVFAIFSVAMGITWGEIVDPHNQYSSYKEKLENPEEAIVTAIAAAETALKVSGPHLSGQAVSELKSSAEFWTLILDIKRNTSAYKQKEEVALARYREIFPLTWLQMLGSMLISMFILTPISRFVTDFGKKMLRAGAENQINKRWNLLPHEVHPLIPYWEEGDKIRAVGQRNLIKNTETLERIKDREGYSYFFEEFSFVSFSEEGILIKNSQGVYRVPAIAVISNDTFEKQRKADILKKMDDESMYKAKLRILAEDSLGQKIS